MKTLLINNNQLINDAKGISRYYYSLEHYLKPKFKLEKLFDSKAGTIGRKVREQLYFTRGKKYDVMWSPGHPGPYFAKRHVITIHDLIPLHPHSGISKNYQLYFRNSVGTLVKNAAQVICISQTVADLIQDTFKAKSDQLTIIQNGYDLLLKKELVGAPAKNPLKGKKYILFVGTFSAHKNLVRLMDAFKLFRSQQGDSDCHLAIAGHFPKTISLGNFNVNIPELLKHNIVFFDDPDDSLLDALYLDSHGVVMPSLVEGFGLPITEGFSYNKPVICSDIPVFRELFSGCIRSFFDPYNVESMTASIAEVFRTGGQMTVAEARHYGQKKAWTWERAANACEVLFNRIAN